MANIGKKEIVKMLLKNKELENEDEEQLMEILFSESFDPYPFILLNLVLSCVSALQAPFIMMSQNRSAKKDSLRAKNDYKTDLKSELILEELHDEMMKLQSTQNKILRLLNEEKKDEKKAE